MKFTKLVFPIFILLTGAMIIASCGARTTERPAGKPYKGVFQKIPGKIQSEFFDEGGEGFAYHEMDSVNAGSGTLNRADGTFLNEFRKSEAVDISYTKFTDPATDNSQYNLADQQHGQLYVGWINPGEWMNYTVDLRIGGTFKIGIMYAAEQDAEISLGLNQADATGTLKIPSTASFNEPEPWRQAHHWNYLDSIGTVKIEKGIQTLRMNALTGGMKIDYIDFVRIK
jgi:Carbohydrate binding module (family 6)